MDPHFTRCRMSSLTRNRPTKPTEQNIRGSLSQIQPPGWWCATPSWTLRIAGPKAFKRCQEMSRAKRGSPGVTTVVTVCQGVLCWLLRVVFLWFCKLAFRIFSRGYRHGLWSHLSLSLRHHPQHYHERFLFVIPDIVIPWPWVVGAHVVSYHYPQQDPHL